MVSTEKLQTMQTAGSAVLEHKKKLKTDGLTVIFPEYSGSFSLVSTESGPES